MIEDVVVDTNVFVHSDNPGVDEFESSLRFMNRLLESLVALCIDDGFNVDESKNRSLIGNEYFKHIKGTLAKSVLAHLAQNQRIKVVGKSVEHSQRKLILQSVSNKRDRNFLFVALNSSSKHLVSHDFRDFNKSKRKFINKKVGVIFATASECCVLFQDY